MNELSPDEIRAQFLRTQSELDAVRSLVVSLAAQLTQRTVKDVQRELDGVQATMHDVRAKQYFPLP